jgi:hypothetical protein
MSPVKGYLVVVSCGKDKIWRLRPNVGPTAAREAYASPVFKTSRSYAERFGERWLILSAKYGLVAPEFTIAENYNRSFYDPDAISVHELRLQVTATQLAGFRTVGVLGSDIYWRRVCEAFDGTSVTLRHINGNVGFPPSFQRLVGELIANNTPFPRDLSA